MTTGIMKSKNRTDNTDTGGDKEKPHVYGEHIRENLFGEDRDDPSRYRYRNEFHSYRFRMYEQHKASRRGFEDYNRRDSEFSKQWEEHKENSAQKIQQEPSTFENLLKSLYRKVIYDYHDFSRMYPQGVVCIERDHYIILTPYAGRMLLTGHKDLPKYGFPCYVKVKRNEVTMDIESVLEYQHISRRTYYDRFVEHLR